MNLYMTIIYRIFIVVNQFDPVRDRFFPDRTRPKKIVIPVPTGPRRDRPTVIQILMQYFSS